MKEILIVGLNNFGNEIARALANNCEVTVADFHEDRLLHIKQSVRRVLLLDKNNPENLDKLNFDHVDSVIVLINGNDLFFSMAVVLILKRLGAKNIYVCVENEDQENLVNLLGEVTVIRSDVQVSNALVEKLSSGPVKNFT